MKRKNLAISLSTLAMLCVSGCDPSKDALKLFTKQGLTVLKPARDFMKLGGFFVLPKSGAPIYQDPWDQLSGTNGESSPFSAVILQEGQSSSVGLQAAVGTLGGLVPIPAGMQFSSSEQVNLDKIDSSGLRYTSQQMNALIQKSATQKAIATFLQQGNKVYIIQEIYKAKSLNLKSSSSHSLAGAVFGSVQVQNCSQNTGSGGTGTGGTNTGGTGTPGTGTPAGGTDTQGTGTAGSKAGTPGTGTGGTAKGGTGTGGTGTGSSVGISVGACWANAYTLSFNSDNPLPFAVRLNEIGLDSGTVLSIKVTNFQVPGALGGDTKAVVVLDPLIDVMQGSH